MCVNIRHPLTTQQIHYDNEMMSFLVVHVTFRPINQLRESTKNYLSDDDHMMNYKNQCKVSSSL